MYTQKELNEISIPKAVTDIGNYAFSGCTGLSSITIPEAATEIGGNALSECSALDTIISKSTTPSTLSRIVFLRICA